MSTSVLGDFELGSGVLGSAFSPTPITASASSNLNSWGDTFSSSLGITLFVTVASDGDNWADAISVNLAITAGNVAVADSLSNWGDSVSVATPNYSLVFTDSIANLLDSVNVQVSIAIAVSNNLNFWDDKIAPSFSLGKAVSDTLSLSDSVSTGVLGLQSVTQADDLNNWGEDVSVLSNLILKINETLDRWRDTLEVLKTQNLSISSDLNSWADSSLAGLYSELTQAIASSLNSWDDSVANEFISRLERNKKALLTTYIRRYLNDPKVPITKDIRIEVEDGNSNNWQDGVS